jgi:DNA-binding NarL/FixJ family response regulator
VSQKINVFLLAGNRLFREELARMLRAKSDVSVVGSESCSPGTVTQVERCECDVVLIDPETGEYCDIELVQSIARAAPSAKLILIGMVADEATFLKAVHAGVAGYLLQHASAVDVVEAIRAVYQGDAVCPPRLCMALFKHLATAGDGLVRDKTGTKGRIHARLTRREQQLVPLISQGLTNKEIAAQLNLSEQTVKNHVHRILQRMGAMNRFAAVEIARDRNLLAQP